MRQLKLLALSDDGAQLILVGDGDERLALQVDERLHAAIRGDRARLGQLEIQLESQLRPRDIQARVRAGESVETVAAVAGMPLDKVRRFAGPVIAEREHIADRARQATVRRSATTDGKPPTLEAAASESAKAHGVKADQIEWDAWRREDGRWLVKCAWTVEEDEIFATFSFDPSGRSATPEDDAARLLSGDLTPERAVRPSAVAAPAPAALPAPAPEPEVVEPRLSVVAPTDDGPETVESDDAVDDVQPAAVGEQRRPRRPYARDREPWERDDESDRDEITSERLRLSDIATKVDGPATAELEPVAEADATPADDPQPKRYSKNRRPSVPSWDEIMFGRRKSD